MKLRAMQSLLVGLVVVTMAALYVESVTAQCATTCAAPTTAFQTAAYQPVAYQVAQPAAYRPYTGWYPGKFINLWRSRGLTTAAPVAPNYMAAYAPYTAGYSPYTARYAPRQVAYRPYVTSYALLAPACTSCVQTVARPVVMRPVIAASCSGCGCDPCSCSGCSACSGSVSQASYTEPACSSCAASAPIYTTPSSPASPSSIGQPIVGPQTPQPQLQPTPEDSTYRSNRPLEGSSSPQNSGGSAEEPQQDPGPADSSDSSTYFDLRAPKLLDPSDRTALRTSSRKPTVDVWTAVYRKAKTSRVSQVSHDRAQAEIDAEGWTAVNSGR